MNQRLNLGVASCAAAALTATLAAPSADAVVVTVTSGVDAGLVVFDSGGFEGDTVGSVPSATSPAGTGWSGTAITNGTTAVRTGATLNGPASAYQGTRYINNDRSIGGAVLNGTFSRDIVPANESFQVEFAMWMDQTTDVSTVPPQAYFFLQPRSAGTSSPAYANLLAGFGMRYTADDTGPTELMKYRISGSSPNYTVSTTSLASPPTWIEGEWNEVLFEWDSVTRRATLTVGSQSPVDVTFAFSDGTFPSNYALPATVGQFQIRSNNEDTNVFVDSIPEPSAIALLGLGGAVLCGRRRVHG